jgi:hypothetical protein
LRFEGKGGEVKKARREKSENEKEEEVEKANDGNKTRPTTERREASQKKPEFLDGEGS